MALPETLELPENTMVLHLATNRQVDLGRLGSFLGAIAEYAGEFFEDDPQLELVSLKTGSVTATITAWGSVIAGVGGIGIFALALVDVIERTRKRKVGRRAAELCIDDDVVQIDIAASGDIRIGVPASNIRAIQTVLAARARNDINAYSRPFDEAGIDFTTESESERARDVGYARPVGGLGRLLAPNHYAGGTDATEVDWSAPASVRNTLRIAQGETERVEVKNLPLNVSIAVAMSEVLGRLGQLRLELQDGSRAWEGREIATLAADPRRPALS